jgi:hypothetical protein
VRATKEGYDGITIRWTCLDSFCSPAPVLMFTLRGLTPPVDIAGNYTVTMSADPACADIPSAARTRTYSGSLGLYEFVDWNYRAQLAGATFLADQGGFFPVLDAFGARVAADYVVLDLDDFGGPAVVEQIAPNTYLAYWGEAAVSVASGSSTISATFDGYVEFCATKSPMEHGYECRQDQRADPTPSQPVTYTRCESKNHQLVLTRRP